MLSAALALICAACGPLRTPPRSGSASGAGIVPPGANNSDAGLNTTPLPIVPVIRPETSTPAIIGETRPWNPAQLGEGAQLAVGRTFDPVYFDFDSAQILPAASRKLHECALWLRENPKVMLVLTGHTDAHGSPEYNYNLGIARALAVQDYLAGEGIEARRTFPISYGEDRPASQGDTPESDALNRRVELLGFIVPEGATPPSPVTVAPGNAPGALTPIKPIKGVEVPRETK